jgi:L,D-transpeptidase YcbB
MSFAKLLAAAAAIGQRSVIALILATLAAGPCTTGSFAGARGQSPSGQVSNSELREIVHAGRLENLRWPDFSDYVPHLKRFYAPSNYALAWSVNNRATPQARAIIEVLQEADAKGLNAQDYDAGRWSARLDELRQPNAAATFDAALTVCTMRYISDLHIGRVNPQHFSFGLSIQRKKYDLAQFIRDRLVDGNEIRAVLNSVEPPFAGYKRTEAALDRYLKLAQQDDGQKLPDVSKPVEPGNEYAGIPRLARLLRLLGDLRESAQLKPGNVYQEPLVSAVKHFQERHGLTANGRMGPQTLKQLNTPLSSRVEQLRLTMERWRWVPEQFTQPPVVVNIPEFRLRAFNNQGRVVLGMNVIVGKAYRHETPVFEEDMRYIVFRPYWNVPPSIERAEIVPAVERDRDYVAKKGFEVVTPGGQVVTSGAISDSVLQQLRAGKLAVRQKPGPNNALGLVKLMFPNEYNVYLHSTPSQQLFSESRRDFSHGCIRVEKPAELAAWALSNQPEWTLEKVRAAMQSGGDNVTVNLAKPIPVLILYGTAVVEENGDVHFFDDLYGYDAALAKVLAKGYPYPG